MAMRVLVAMDHSPLAETALQEALETFPDAEVTVLHVIDYIERAQAAKLLLGSEELAERAEARTAELFDRVREIAATRDGEVETVRRIGRPGEEIVSYAVDHDVDRVFVGSHGRGTVRRLLLGSVAERVIRESPVPVTVVR